jgi:ribosome-associated heat shock protein Hsp15
MSKQDESKSVFMRIDKWLWCARFYKTRGLASEAVRTGKILVGNTRTKPAKTIQAGVQLKIRKGPFIQEIEVLSLPRTRLSAREINTVYKETEESLVNREQSGEQLRLGAMKYPRARGRPTKRDRRALIRFKNKV